MCCSDLHVVCIYTFVYTVCMAMGLLGITWIWWHASWCKQLHDYVTFSWFLKMLNVSHTFFHNFLWMFLYISHVKFTWSIVHDFTAHISHNFTHISQFHISFSQHLMMWKGGHHFTWFSHGDFTLFFTDVWNCMWKTKWKFHMYFTCISHHFFQ